jgi:hypothetical protein
MNLKIKTLLVVSVGLLLSSCGQPTTPVGLYAVSAAQLVSFEEGLNDELEFHTMGQMPLLQGQQLDWLTESMTSPFQTDWVEIREMFVLVKGQQRLQNHQRLLIKMETSMLRALATVIENHEIALSEAIIMSLAASQATLIETKTSIQQDRDAQKIIIRLLRSLIRSGNRPSTWTDSLITTIKANLTELLAIQASLLHHMLDVYPAVSAMREILAASVPSDLMPLTDAVLDDLSIFQLQMHDLNTFQSQIHLKQQDIRSLLETLRTTVSTWRENALSLSQEDQVALGIKRLAIQDAYGSLKEVGKAMVTGFRSLKGMIHFEHLSEIHATLATLMGQKETFLSIQSTIEQRLVETLAILNA